MMSFAVLTIVKATLVCGLAFVLSHVCRRTRASIRHLLFALAFAALVAIPGAGPVVPTVAVTVQRLLRRSNVTEHKTWPRTCRRAQAQIASAVQRAFDLSRHGTAQRR